jgi:hypothetical protein
MATKKVEQMNDVHIDEIMNRMERVKWVVIKELK